MFKTFFLLTSLTVMLIAADPLPFTGTWHARSMAASGQVYRTEVRNGVYTCSPCADPIDKMPVDGADHKVPNLPDTFSIRTVGSKGIEVVRKSGGKVISRTIRMVSDDGRRLEILTLQDLPSGDATWVLDKRERVGEPVSGAHPISGSWKNVSLDGSPNTLPTFSYEQTTTGMKLSDLSSGSSRIVYDARFDGKDYPMTGGPDGATVTLRRINDRTIEEIWKQKGVEVTRASMVISADGKTLTQTNFHGSEQAGAPQVADRQPVSGGR